MKKLLLCLLVLNLIACQPAEEPVPTVDEPAGQPLSVSAIADQFIVNLFKFSPELGTYYQIDNADNVNLTDITPAGISRSEEAQDTLYQTLKAVDVAQLSKNDWITYQLLKTELEGAMNQRICYRHLWSINHLDAFYIWYQYIGKNQPVGDDASRADTLARWAQIPDYINNDMANNKKGLEAGYALPRPVVERVIGQMEQLLASPLEENVFYLPAMRDANPEFQQKMKDQVENNIMPAIQTYLTFMQEEYLGQARPTLSISTIPNGPACYTAMLNASTTLSNSPAEIYAWGEEAIAEREAMIRLLGKQIYGSDDLAVIKATFNNDPNNFFKTKAELLVDAQAAIDRAKIKSKDYFNLYPKSDVILEPISEIEEKTGYSRYLAASDDGSRPATYIQATYPPEKQVKGNIESTAFHETYPGHHLQIAISRELVTSHPVTKYIWNSGFSEGWARYTETLADEIGLYSSDNHRMAMYMGLPTGMVVDPGIHFKNWTRAEAIAYTLSKQTSMTKDDAERYVDRISVWPGQMTTYGVGERFFINLRKQAKTQLGEAFDIKAFHDICLQNGTVPLDFVSAEVGRYLGN
jgi:uncharacterized protein (DUF885 family)